MALTKADITQSLFDELGLNKREARELVDTCFEEMRQALESGHEIKISGFGNFELKDKTTCLVVLFAKMETLFRQLKKLSVSTSILVWLFSGITLLKSGKASLIVLEITVKFFCSV